MMRPHFEKCGLNCISSVGPAFPFSNFLKKQCLLCHFKFSIAVPVSFRNYRLISRKIHILYRLYARLFGPLFCPIILLLKSFYFSHKIPILWMFPCTIWTFESFLRIVFRIVNGIEKKILLTNPHQDVCTGQVNVNKWTPGVAGF